MTAYCDDILDDQKPSCCDSCHDDFEAYPGDYEVEVELFGNTYIVCCSVASWLKSLEATPRHKQRVPEVRDDSWAV